MRHFEKEPKEYVELTLEICAVSPDAVLVSDGQVHWVPRSVIKNGQHFTVENIGETLEIEIETWIAEIKGLI